MPTALAASLVAPRDRRHAASVAMPAGALSPARARARRRVVQLVLAIYLLAIVEGALRKWVLPQYSQYIYFIRDPILLWAYVLATLHALWPRRNPFFATAIGMAGFGVVLPVIQAALGEFSETRLLLAVYGWRSYFLYLPLAFLVGAQFHRADVLRLLRWTLWLAAPVGLLVMAQFASPPGAAINVGIATDEAYQFRSVGLTADRVRPQGPFASGAGQQVFVASAFALLVAAFLAGPRTGMPGKPILLLGGAGVLTCIALSGSRGTVLQCALSGLFALAVGVFGRGGALKSRAMLWPLAIGGGALLLYPIVFPEGFETFVWRWIEADKSDSRAFSGGIFGRALYGLVDFTRLIQTVPALGYGLGYGGNASITLRATVDGIMPGHLVETDFARHMVDLGPAFGMPFIAYRLALAAWLATIVLRVTRLAPDPLPMLLLSFAGYLVVLGQITGQGTITFFAWFFTGLLIAACRNPYFPARRARAAAPDRRPAR